MQLEVVKNLYYIHDAGLKQILGGANGIHIRDNGVMNKTEVTIAEMTSDIMVKKILPDKTSIGCIKRGFDILGLHWGEYLKISKTSIENHRAKLAQRYARDTSTACIGDYVARWSSWCKGLLTRCSDDCNENETHVIAKVTTNLRSMLENYHEYQTQSS